MYKVWQKENLFCSMRKTKSSHLPPFLGLGQRMMVLAPRWLAAAFHSHRLRRRSFLRIRQWVRLKKKKSYENVLLNYVMYTAHQRQMYNCSATSSFPSFFIFFLLCLQVIIIIIDLSECKNMINKKEKKISLWWKRQCFDTWIAWNVYTYL